MLVNVFEDVYQRVARDATGEASRVLIRLVASLAEGVELNLAELEALPQPDQALALALFDYCFNRGLSEEERSAVSDAFAPFVGMHRAGVRH
jgi:hypothetical protein